MAWRGGRSLQYGHDFRLVQVWLRVWNGCTQRVHFKISPGKSTGAFPDQNRHGVSRHAGELEGKRSVKQHDDDAEHPLEDGRSVLQGEALLTEKHAAWKHR